MVAIVFLIVMTFFSGGLRAERTPEDNPDNDYLEMSVLYQQQASEYRALCYQAYNFAEYRLRSILTKTSSPESLAVIVDIDETVLDNSPYEAELILENIDYPERWTEWIEKATARPVPGSLEFLRFADSSSVRVFYVSNRRDQTRESTMKNLEAVGFPQVRKEHMYLRTDESSKEYRRHRIDRHYNIAMLIGDNLNDFSEVFEGRLNQDRNTAVDLLQEYFGERFIVLPNAMYGEWEGAVYGYDWSMTDAQKDSVRKETLRGF